MGDPEGGAAGPSTSLGLADALQHLYDAAELSRSPLLPLLGLDRQSNPALALRRILVETIDSLKPSANVPRESKDWRVHRVLVHRYVQGFTQKQVASTLSLSPRQVRREEARGVQLVADRLSSLYGLEPQVSQAGSTWSPAAWAAGPPDPRISRRDEELAWVKNSFPSARTDVNELVRMALGVLDPLARSLCTHVRHRTDQRPLSATVQPGSVRQALMSILTVAIRTAPGGWVDVEAESGGRQVTITIQSRKSHLVSSSLDRDALDGLAMARRLVEISEGSLEIVADEDGERPLSVKLILPTGERTVLVVDDNADTLRLYQRHLAGTGYAFVGAGDAERAMELATTAVPYVIVLDVMLPGIDGWHLLERLREHPATRGVPIVVCSILPEEHLAMALGAVAFLRKPVNREALLSTLDRQLDPERREGR